MGVLQRRNNPSFIQDASHILLCTSNTIESGVDIHSRLFSVSLIFVIVSVKLSSRDEKYYSTDFRLLRMEVPSLDLDVYGV